MSYIVLARKYRPQTFTEVYAQEHITEILRNAILSNRVRHAYLFTGHRLDELDRVARTLAKTLNCQQPVSKGREQVVVDCCDACANCRKESAPSVWTSLSGSSVNVCVVALNLFRYMSRWSMPSLQPLETPCPRCSERPS